MKREQLERAMTWIPGDVTDRRADSAAALTKEHPGTPVVAAVPAESESSRAENSAARWASDLSRAHGVSYGSRLMQAVATGTAGGVDRRPADYGYVDCAGCVWISETDERDVWLALPDQGDEVVVALDHLPAAGAPYFRIFSRDLVETLRGKFHRVQDETPSRIG